MPFPKWVTSVKDYLFGPPPVTADHTGVTINAFAYINVNVEAGLGHDTPEPAQKTGKEKAKWLLKCKDNFPKPVRHRKALCSNVSMKKRTWTDIENDTNERAHVHRNTTHPTNYYEN